MTVSLGSLLYMDLYLSVPLHHCLSTSLSLSITASLSLCPSPSVPLYLSVPLHHCLSISLSLSITASLSLLLHSEKWLACQSMDNQIMIYGVHTNFRLNRKKNFKGHMVCTCTCVLVQRFIFICMYCLLSLLYRWLGMHAVLISLLMEGLPRITIEPLCY